MSDDVESHDRQAQWDQWISKMNAWFAEGGTYRVRPVFPTAVSCLAVLLLFFPALFLFLALIAGSWTYAVISAIAASLPFLGFASLWIRRRNVALYLNQGEIGRTGVRGYPIAWHPRAHADLFMLGSDPSDWDAAQLEALRLLLASDMHPVDPVAGTGPSKRSVREVQAEAQRLFHFTPNDVASNRVGVMTGHQILRLCQRELLLLSWAVGSLSVACLMLWALIHGLVWWADPKAVVIVLLSLGFFAYSIGKGWSVAMDALGRKIKAASGVLNMHVEERNLPIGSAHVCRFRLVRDQTYVAWPDGYDHQLGPIAGDLGVEGVDLDFDAPISATDRLPEQIGGSVYFTPRSRRLLAIEATSAHGFRMPVHR